MECHVKINDIFEYLAILTLIFASGANLYIRSIYVFFGCCLLLLIYKKQLDNRLLLICIAIMAYIVFNSVIINTAPTNLKECLLMAVRLFCCVIIISCVRIEKFKQIFLNIMCVLCLMSLFFFLLILLGITLPGAGHIEGVYGTFYQTIGYTTTTYVSRNRNCGIFTEPGMYQMYINLALLILWSDRTMETRKVKKIFWLFTITLISTFSSMGYLIYAVVLLLYYVERREVLPQIRNSRRLDRVFLLLIALVLIGIIEMNSGMITSFVTGTNSYASRHDDTVLTFIMALDYPFFGVGLATNVINIWDYYYEAFAHLRLYTAYQAAMSNGLGNYLFMAGIPFTLIYVINILQSYFYMLEAKKALSKILIAIVMLMFLMEEPIMSTPFFLLSFFVNIKKSGGMKKWTAKDKKTVIM